MQYEDLVFCCLLTCNVTSFLKGKFIAFHEMGLRECERRTNGGWKTISVKYIILGSFKVGFFLVCRITIQPRSLYNSFTFVNWSFLKGRLQVTYSIGLQNIHKNKVKKDDGKPLISPHCKSIPPPLLVYPLFLTILFHPPPQLCQILEIPFFFNKVGEVHPKIISEICSQD